MQPEYREFRLVSGNAPQSHHLMKLNSEKYSIKDFQPQVKIYREPASAASVGEQDGTTAGASLDPKFDPSKVAPGSSLLSKKVPAFRKRTKTFIVEREEGEDDDAKAKSGPSIVSRRNVEDPDKDPWVLTNNEKSIVYEGNLEGSQNSSYVFFMFSEDGFKVIPCDKWYRFTQRPQYHKLTIEEAEESLAKRASRGMKSQERWMMHKKKTEDEPAGPVKPKLKVADGPKRRPMNGGEDGEEELDFEEDFQDDDGLVELGIEDEEESKEAHQRALGGKLTKKANFDDLFVEELAPKAKDHNELVKQMTKSIKKLEKNSVFLSDEEENPYVSDMEEDDDRERSPESQNEKQRGAGRMSPTGNTAMQSQAQKSDTKANSPEALLEALQKEKTKREAKMMKRGGSMSPSYSKEAHASSIRAKTASPMHFPAKAKSPPQDPSSGSSGAFKIKLKPSGASSAPNLLAAELKRKREEEYAENKKSRPLSPSGGSASPQYALGTPARFTPRSEKDVVLISENDVRQVLKATGPISSRELIAKLRERFTFTEKNQELLKKILKKLVVHRKELNVLELKEQ